MSGDPLALQAVRELTLDGSVPGAPRFLAAASGLVASPDRLFVIADDDLHLGLFPSEGSAPGRAMRLLPGRLPEAKDERKAQKPDFEVLLRLPPFGGYERGALLALGSGSTRRRARGVLVDLAETDAPAPMTELIDFTALYAALEQAVPELNLEGAVLSGDRLLLLQRGNGKGAQNALVALGLSELLQTLGEGSLPRPSCIRGVTPVALGEVEGVPLGFTDGALLPDGRLLYSAVAEATHSSYADGPCLGAVLGVLGLDGAPLAQRRLEGCVKVEGLCAVPGRPDELLLVADADDATRPAMLYRARQPF